MFFKTKTHLQTMLSGVFCSRKAFSLYKKSSFFAMAFSAFLLNGAELPTHLQKEVRTIYPEASNFYDAGKGMFLIKNKNGTVCGKVYTETYPDSKRKIGFAGTIEVAVVTDNNDNVSGVLIGKNNETPRWLSRLHKAEFLKRWNKLNLRDVADKDVEAVTGATMSSEAIEHGVRQIAQSALDQPLLIDDPAYLKKEIARLTKLRTQIKSSLDRSEKARKQLRERKDEELELRFIAAVKGNKAAAEFARARGLLFSFRPAGNHSHGSGKRNQQGRVQRQSPIDIAAKAYKANPSAENLTKLKKVILDDYEKRLKAPVSHREINIKKRLEKIDARIAELQKKGAR